MEAIETIEHANCEINIYYDDYPESPRSWYNLGTMICWHNRYNLGDDHDFESPQDLDESLERGYISLPLYLFDHSGITMNTTGFHCPWDSGQVGIIYVTTERVRDWFSVQRISEKLRTQVIRRLKSEVEAYDQFLTGMVYGYNTEHLKSGEEDSCWGFYDEMDYVIEEAKSAAEYLDKEHRGFRESKVKQLIKAHVPLDVRQGIIKSI